MRKLIFLTLLLFIHISLNGQNQHVVRCAALVGAASCGSCSNWQIGQVSLYEVNGTTEIHKGNIINSSNYNNLEVAHYMEIIIDVGSKIEYRFTDPIDGSQKVYVFDPTDNSITDDGHYYHYERQSWIRWHRANADFWADANDSYEMENVRDHPGGSTDINFCVTDPNYTYIRFNLSPLADKPNDLYANYEYYLCASTYDNNQYIPLDRIRLNGLDWDSAPHYYAGGDYVINVSQFLTESLYGEDIFFRIETIINGLSIYSNYKDFRFYPVVQNPSSMVPTQLVCDPFTKIEITFPTDQTDLSLEQYEFRARPNDLPETTSNIIKFNKTNIGTHSITLEVDELSRSLIGDEAKLYTFQMYKNTQPFDTELISNHACARTWSNFRMPARPQKLSLSYTLTEHNFNTQTYHISSSGASDGEALLEVQPGPEGRFGHYEYYKNGSWHIIPQDSLETRNGSTYLIDLYATTYYLRVVDTQGCPSDSINFTLVEPSPLEITNLDSTLVNCHVSNLGEHADAQIAIHFTGGIGPYEVEVFDEENNSVYTQNVTADDFLADDPICHINTLENLEVGNYRVLVTDDSNIEAEDNIEVISNPELILTATPIPYDCYGSADGAILLRLQNREGLSINYGLNGDTIERSFVDTAYYNYLVEGIYEAGAINSRQCKDVVENIQIIQPNSMEINGAVTNPVCYNSFDGSITTNVTGGNGSYRYEWSNGETSSSLTSLNNGNYTLIVKDAKDCSNEQIFTLTPPVAPSANWYETSAVLCTGNTRTLDGGDFTAYQWKKDGEAISNERYQILSEAGLYTLELTNEHSCISTDTFKLELSDHPLDAVLLLQDSAKISELVEVIDVTWPIPDSVNWYFDKPVFLGNYNEWSQQFSVDNQSIVNVTLRAWYGGCFSDSTKTITIYASDEKLDNKKLEVMPLILGCKLWPNPNDGNFSLEVKLNEESDISVLVYSLQNHSKLFSKNYNGLKKYEIPFQFNDLSTGVYLIIVKAKNEQQSLKFIIKK